MFYWYFFLFESTVGEYHKTNLIYIKSMLGLIIYYLPNVTLHVLLLLSQSTQSLSLFLCVRYTETIPISHSKTLWTSCIKEKTNKNKNKKNQNKYLF